MPAVFGIGSGNRGRADCPSVERAHKCNHRTSRAVRHCQFEGAVCGFRAAVTEKDRAQFAWCFLRKPFCQRQCRLVVYKVKRRIDKISRLLLNSFHDSRVVVPQCIDSDSLNKVKVAVAIDIGQIAPGSTFCHQIRLLIKNGTQILFVIFKFNHNKTSILV